MENLERYLDELASSQPTPGGGSAATVVAAVGAALVAMVARICAENPRYAEWRELAVNTIEAADALRRELLEAGSRDERAYARVVAAQQMPSQSPDEREARTRALQVALREAAEEPLHACALCVRVLQLAAEASQIPNKALASDLGCAAEFGFAGLASSAYNVRVNHRYMREAKAIEDQTSALERYESEAAQRLASIRASVSAALRTSPKTA